MSPSPQPGEAPEPDAQTGAVPAMPPGVARAGALLCLLEAVVLLGFAAFYLVELARGEGSGVGTVVLSAALIAVTGVLLLVLARFWQRGSRRAVTPTVVWNLLLVPAALTVFSSGQPLVAGLIALVVVASLATAAAAASRRT